MIIIIVVVFFIIIRYTFYFYLLCRNQVSITCHFYLFCCSFIFPFEQLFQFKKIVTKISKIIKLKNNFFIINNYLI